MNPARRYSWSAPRLLAILAQLAVLGDCSSPARLFAASDPSALGLGEVRWGFDGASQANTFVPVSIEIHNQSDLPWQGELHLGQVMGASRSQVPQVMPLSLQGRESRWVQFCVLTHFAVEEWEVSWGPGAGHSASLPPVRVGRKSTVLIHDASSVNLAEGALKRFPEDLFPQSVTACGGLRSVALDHAPFWQGARAQAFLDWLRGGGRVEILRNARGEWPVFPAPLTELNQSLPTYRVGIGLVRRLDLQASQLDGEILRRERVLDESPVDASTEATRRLSQTSGSLGFGFNTSWDVNSGIFSRLRTTLAFRRRWWLIDLCVFAYVLALYPGCWYIGRVRRNVGGFYVAFAAATVLFSILFGLLGRLDESNTSRIATAGAAREVGDGTFEFSEWTLWRAAAGGTFAAGHPGSGHCYSTTDAMDALTGVVRISGRLQPGPVGSAEFNLPPASMQSLRHSSRVTIPRPRPQILQLQSEEGRLEQLRVSVAGSPAEHPLHAWGLLRGRCWQLEVEGDSITLPAKPVSENLALVLEERLDLNATTWGFTPRLGRTGGNPEEDRDWQAIRQQLMPWLVGHSLGLTDELHPRYLQTQSNDVRLAVLSPLPTELRATSEDFADQIGCVLFLYNLSSPAK